MPSGFHSQLHGAQGHDSGPFLQFFNRIGITRDRFVSAERPALDSAGYSSSLFTGHSFRLSAATTVTQCGILDSLINTLGR